MKRLISVLMVTMVLSFVLGTGIPTTVQASPSNPDAIAVGTAGVGGVFYVLAVSLADIISKHTKMMKKKPIAKKVKSKILSLGLLLGAAVAAVSMGFGLSQAQADPGDPAVGLYGGLGAVYRRGALSAGLGHAPPAWINPTHNCAFSGLGALQRPRPTLERCVQETTPGYARRFEFGADQ